MSSKKISRREFLKDSGIAVGGIALASSVLASCSATEATSNPASTTTQTATTTQTVTTTTTAAAPISTVPVFKWTMQVEGPATFPVSLEVKAMWDRIRVASGGRIDMTVRYSGDIVPYYKEAESLKGGVLDASVFDIGQAFGIYGTKAYLFGSSGTPGGQTAEQNLAWAYTGDGIKLAADLMKDYGVPIGPFQQPSEAFAHSNKPLDSAASFKGLKFRTAGIWGTMLKDSFGASVVTLSGGDLYQAIKSGLVDAFEYATPSSNWGMGFQEVAKYMGFPGIHSPSSAIWTFISNKNWNALPNDLKQIIQDEQLKSTMLCLTSTRLNDAVALKKFKDFGTQFFYLSDDFQKQIVTVSRAFFLDSYQKDAAFAKIWDNLQNFVITYKSMQDNEPKYNMFQQ